MRLRQFIFAVVMATGALTAAAQQRQVLTDTIVDHQPYVLLNNGLLMPRFGIGTFNVPVTASWQTPYRSP